MKQTTKGTGMSYQRKKHQLHELQQREASRERRRKRLKAKKIKGRGRKAIYAACVALALMPAAANASKTHHPHHHKSAHHHHKAAAHHKAAPLSAEPLANGETYNDSPKAGRFLTYGNTVIGDCTFAATANYEIAAFGSVAPETNIEAEFHEAGGSDTNGLEIAKWEAYYATHGIGGIKMTVTGHAPAYVTELGGPGIADIRLTAGEELGGAVIGVNGYHMVTILGTSAGGVLAVSAGYEVTLPWSQWNNIAVEVYTMSAA